MTNDADRKAALECLQNLRDTSPKFEREMLAGERDASLTVQAFTAHREAAAKAREAEIVAWLRDLDRPTGPMWLDSDERLADAIEGGDHRKDGE